MPDEKLTSVFDACMEGKGPDGWKAESAGEFDTLISPHVTPMIWKRRQGRRWVEQPEGAFDA